MSEPRKVNKDLCDERHGNIDKFIAKADEAMSVIPGLMASFDAHLKQQKSGLFKMYLAIMGSILGTALITLGITIWRSK